MTAARRRTEAYLLISRYACWIMDNRLAGDAETTAVVEAFRDRALADFRAQATLGWEIGAHADEGVAP